MSGSRERQERRVCGKKFKENAYGNQSETVEVFFILQKIKTGETKVIKFISENWQLITFVSTCMIYLGRQVLATRKGIRALLRADLIRLYNKYHDDLGYCPIYVKQSLEDEYREYHALKGNGVGTNLYEALMDLQQSQGKENKHV